MIWARIRYALLMMSNSTLGEKSSSWTKLDLQATFDSRKSLSRKTKKIAQQNGKDFTGNELSKESKHNNKHCIH